MRVVWKDKPAPLTAQEDDDITTPVYVPRGRIDTISNDSTLPDRHRATHARDTINIHPDSAGVAIQLDDGSGFGYAFPMPCDGVELRMRRKGQRQWLTTLETVSAQFGSTLEIRFPRDWPEYPPGYYEVKILFRSGDRVNEGGWLLFHKDARPSALTVDAHQVRRRPEANAPIGHHIEKE